MNGRASELVKVYQFLFFSFQNGRVCILCFNNELKVWMVDTLLQ